VVRDVRKPDWTVEVRRWKMLLDGDDEMDDEMIDMVG